MKTTRRIVLAAIAGAIAHGCKPGPDLCIAEVVKMEGPRFADIRYRAGDVEYVESRLFNVAETARLFRMPETKLSCFIERVNSRAARGFGPRPIA